MPEPERGQSRIVVYLDAVTPNEVEDLLDAVCDTLAGRGFGVEDDDDPVRAIVGLQAEPFPRLDDENQVQGFLDRHVQLAFPRGGGS